MHTIKASLLALAIGALLVGCGGGIDLEDDPRGQEACDLLVRSIQYNGDAEQGMGSLLGAGQAAAKSRTEEIRATVEVVDGLEDFPVVDPDALTEVCEDAGIEVPEP